MKKGVINESIEEQLAKAGLLTASQPNDDAPDGPALEELEREFEAWQRAQSTPLGLCEIVIEDRR